MSEIKLSHKFKPLFKLLPPDGNYYPEVDTVIITGGRYSAKSYTVGIFSNIALGRFWMEYIIHQDTQTNLLLIL